MTMTITKQQKESGLEKTAKQTASEIVNALAGGLVNAANIYRSYVLGGGDPMELRKHAPVSADLWSTLDDVALGRIDVRALVLPPSRYKAVRALPPTTQGKVIDNGVDVLSGDGTAIRVPISELTDAQSKLVFSHGKIRSISEQSAFLKKAQSSASAPAPGSPVVQFEIKKDKLVVYSPVTLTMSELHRILAQMG